MPRYQIRTPEQLAIEDVIRQMAERAWSAIEDKLDTIKYPLSRKNFHHFHEKVREAITPHLKAFRLCGLSNICVDATLDAPLADTPKKVGGNPWDLVYHVFMNGNAEEFVEQLAGGAFEAIEEFLKPETKEETLKSICHSFREVLASYLFANPLCGKTELCVYSSSDQITPWERE